MPHNAQKSVESILEKKIKSGQKARRMNPAPNLQRNKKTTSANSDSLENTESEMEGSTMQNKFALLKTPESFDESDMSAEECSLINDIRSKNDLLRSQRRMQTITRKTVSPSSKKNKTEKEKRSPAKPTHQVNTTTQAKTSTHEPKQPQAKQQQEKKRDTRPPPINIMHQNVADTVKLLQHHIGTQKFYVKRVHNGKHVLYVENLTEYKKALNLLKATNTTFYTYTPKNDKNHTYLLKGLDNNFSEDEILNDLEALQISDVKFIKVSRFTTKRSRENNILLPIYIIQVSNDSNVNKLLNIKYFNNYAVNWEKIKKNEITQCHNCQLLGHTAQNCNMSYRCVKCNDPHGPGECKIEKNANLDNTKIYCVNCKEHGHPASYRGCPKLVEIRKKLTEKLNRNKETKVAKIAQISRRVISGLNFADALKQNPTTVRATPLLHTQQHTQNAPPMTQVNSNMNSSNDTALKTIMSIIEDFKKSILAQLQGQQTQLINLQTSIKNNAERIDAIFNTIENISDDKNE